jgi:hypothetical protein
MSFVDYYLLYYRQWLITGLLSVILPFLPLFTEVLQRSAPCFSPILWCAYNTPTPLLCVSFQFVFIIQFFFVGWGLVCPESYSGLSQSWLGEYCMMLGAHLLVC